MSLKVRDGIEMTFKKLVLRCSGRKCAVECLRRDTLQPGALSGHHMFQENNAEMEPAPGALENCSTSHRTDPMENPWLGSDAVALMSVFAMRKLAYGKVFVTVSTDNASANARNTYKRSLRRLSSGLCILRFPLTQDRSAVRRRLRLEGAPRLETTSFVAPYTLILWPSTTRIQHS